MQIDVDEYNHPKKHTFCSAILFVDAAIFKFSDHEDDDRARQQVGNTLGILLLVFHSLSNDSSSFAYGGNDFDGRHTAVESFFSLF